MQAGNPDIESIKAQNQPKKYSIRKLFSILLGQVHSLSRARSHGKCTAEKSDVRI